MKKSSQGSQEDLLPPSPSTMPAEAPAIVKGSTWTRFMDGAMSGLLSGIVLQPLQVIKTSMQISPIDKP
jgi:hypothetical protein